MTRGVNPSAIESVPVPGADPVYSMAIDMRTIGKVLVKVTNNTDKQVAVVLERTTFDDPDFDAPVATDGVDLAADATTYVVESDPWSWIRVKATPAEAPAGGSTVDLVWEFRHGRD
ncbi:MAG: hypothetical protein QMD46_12260 [Methanomicrobiales archaeon]|nr:hypothetical protein [Methanomicrobiales archaeon]